MNPVVLFPNPYVPAAGEVQLVQITQAIVGILISFHSLIGISDQRVLAMSLRGWRFGGHWNHVL